MYKYINIKILYINIYKYIKYYIICCYKIIITTKHADLDLVLLSLKEEQTQLWFLHSWSVHVWVLSE